MEKTTFVPLKKTRVDERGRFYLPESVCQRIFGPNHSRQVTVYIDSHGRVLLVPEKAKDRASAS